MLCERWNVFLNFFLVEKSKIKMDFISDSGAREKNCMNNKIFTQISIHKKDTNLK